MSEKSHGLDILVLHGVRDLLNERQTSVRHLFALQRYTEGHRFLYHYIGDPVTDALKSIPFDAIVLDVTFLCWRWVRPKELFDAVRKKYRWIATHGSIVAAFPQDDFDHSEVLDEWLVELNTELLFTVYGEHRDVLYPRLLAHGTVLIEALTGYVDDDDVALYKAQHIPFSDRSLDVSYRVRRLPAQFGRFGILKSNFGRAFARAASGRATCDISDDPRDALYGEQWLRLLCDSRFVLAAEGGSSVIDKRGEIRERIEAYCSDKPEAEFDDIVRACLRPEDEARTFAAISPRLFEIAMSGACPILLEGNYKGLIQPGEHYISVRKDFSDIEDAVGRLSDIDAAQQMADRYAKKILGNLALRYRNWISRVEAEFKGCKRNASSVRKPSDAQWALLRERHVSTMLHQRDRDLADINEKLRLLGNEAQAVSQRFEADVLRLMTDLDRLEADNRRLMASRSRRLGQRVRRWLSTSRRRKV